VFRNADGRKQPETDGENAGTFYLAVLHARAQRDGVGLIRGGVEHRGVAVAREHVLKGLFELGSGLVGRLFPTRLYEMNVAVLETGGEHASFAL
jgi:hypothetical protein